MKQTLVFLIAWLAATALNAQQSTIVGVVSIHNSQFDTGKRQYVSNAQVEDDFEKASAQVTDANGIFKLIFVGVPEKVTVNLIVKKEGLEVVNIDALGAVTGQRDQVRLSMAAPNKIAEYRRQIYNIGKTEAEKNLAALLQKKGKAIEELQKNAKVDSVKIRNLQTEYAALSEQSKKIEEQAQELARKYAPINLDDASPLYQEAFRFFQKGELDQALKILQQANLAQQADKILQERQSIANVRKEADQRDSIQQQRTVDVIEALLFKAELHKNRFEFDSIVVCFEIMLKLDSMNTTTLWNYGNFLANQNQTQEAIKFYKKGLHSTTSEELKAYFLSTLGSLHSEINQFSEAESFQNDALKIRRQLASKNPDAFLLAVSTNLTSLGNIYRMNNKLKKAEQAYSEAIAIQRQLIKNQKENTVLLYLANSLMNSGIYYFATQQFLQSKAAFIEATEIFRRLSEKNPSFFLPHLANSLNNLGSYYDSVDNDFKQSDSLLNESLKIYNSLAKNNPNAFLPEVANLLENLGKLHLKFNKIEKVDSFLQMSVRIYRELVEKNANQFSDELAECLQVIGRYYNASRKMQEAEEAYAEALNIYRQLALKNPNVYNPLVASILSDIGSLYVKVNKVSQAEKCLIESIQIKKKLNEENPEGHLDELANGLNSLGNFYYQVQRLTEAEYYYNESLIMFRQLIKKDSSVYLRDVAMVLSNLAIIYYNNQKILEAESNLLDALKIYRELAKTSPDIFLPMIAGVSNSLGAIFFSAEKWAQAKASFYEALQIIRQLNTNGSNLFLPSIAEILSNLGECYRNEKKMLEAEAALKEALQIQQELVKENPEVFLLTQSNTLNNLGLYYRDLKNYNTSLNYFNESIGIREKALLNGGSHLYQSWLQVLLNISNLRDSALVKKDYVTAVKAYQQVAESCDNVKGINEQLYAAAVSEYGNLSWRALFVKDFALAEKAALRCLELDKTQEYVLTNLGHSYLLRGQYQQAQITYERLKGKNNTAGKDFKIVLFEDYKELEEAGITHPYMAKMKAWIAGW